MTIHNSDLSHTNSPGPGWRILGELELPAGARADGTIQAWLTEVLTPLQLHEDLLHRIRSSAEDAAARAFETEAAFNFDHLHLNIYVQQDRDTGAGTWGFFRIARIENTGDGTSASIHSIEFYLYIDGQEGAL